MTKQEFFAASLPSGLQVINEEGVRKTYSSVHYSYEFETEFAKFIPIIRPLDSLVKECVQSDYNDGKPFIPIVELAKIVWENEYPDLKYQSLKSESVFIAFTDKKNVFGYDGNTCSFFGGKDGLACSVVNQIQLFQQLLKWHFWPNMPEGEEVVWVTETFNPYK